MKTIMLLGLLLGFSGMAYPNSLIFDTEQEAQVLIDRIDANLGFPVPRWATTTYIESYRTDRDKWAVDIVPCAGTHLATPGLDRRIVDVENELLTVDERNAIVPRPNPKPTGLGVIP